jgi:hypothetical protein
MGQGLSGGAGTTPQEAGITPLCRRCVPVRQDKSESSGTWHRSGASSG